MNPGTGEIHTDISKEEAERRGLIKLTSEEALVLEGVPQARRPCEYALKKYVDGLARKPVGMELFRIKGAFRAGWDAKREQMAGSK